MKAEVEEITITPDKARELLRGNQRNRPLRKEYVAALAEEMKAGRWAFNGMTIVLNGKLLIDGQHRLEACVLSETPFKTLIVRGVDADAFTTIDTGRRRTAADTMATKGEHNYTALAAASAIVEIYYNGTDGERVRFSSGGRHGRNNNQMIANTLKTYPTLRQSVDHCIGRSTKIIPLSILCACHYIFSRIDTTLADIFIDRLVKGHDLKADSPMTKLRNMLLDNYTSARKHSRGYLVSIVIRTWNAERTGRQLKQLKGWTGADSGSFPVAV